LGEDGHADVLRYQVNRLLSRDDIVSALWSYSLTHCCVLDCVMNDGVNSSREQNPFISRQILERYALLLGSSVSQGESHT
jgi:hypothetical protein